MQRPFVYMNMAVTVDGKITSAAREYADFTSEIDRESMDRLRAEADAILIGAATLRSDDPPLRVRNPERRRRRRSLGKPEHPVRVVVTASGELDTASDFFRPAGSEAPMVVTVEDLPADRLQRLQASSEVVQLGRGSVDLPRLMEFLYQRELRRLLLEGGGELNWEMVRQGLVDEIYLTIAPALLGGRSAPTLLEGTGWPMSERCGLELLEIRQEGGELYCRYRVERR